MRISDIMSEAVISVEGDTAADEAWELMKLHAIHHLVVMAKGRVIGIVSDRELGGPHGRAVRQNKAVAELVSESPIHISPTTTVREAANVMRGRSTSCLLVMDGRKVAGIVTVSDVLEAVGSGGALRHPLTTPKRVHQQSAWPRRLH